MTAEFLVDLEAEIERTKKHLTKMEVRAAQYRDIIMGRQTETVFDPLLDEHPATVPDMIEKIILGTTRGWPPADLARVIGLRYRSIQEPVVRSTLHRMKAAGRVRQGADRLWYEKQNPRNMRPVAILLK